MRSRLSIGFFFLFLLLVIAPVFGQNANTSLRGTVKDPNGAVVPGAKINLVNSATGLSFSAESNTCRRVSVRPDPTSQVHHHRYRDRVSAHRPACRAARQTSQPPSISP